MSESHCNGPDRIGGLTPRGWFACVFLAVAAFYAATLNREGFWIDEMTTVWAVRLPFDAMLEHRLSHGHPPLFFAVFWVMARLFEESDWLFRLPVMLSGLASGALLFAIGRRVTDGWLALAAATLLLLSPNQLVLSQDARANIVVQALLLGSTLVVLRADSDTRGSAIGFSALSTLALWSNYTAIPVVAAQTAALFLVRPRRLRAALGGLAAFLLASPVFWATSRRSSIDDRLEWLERYEADPFVETFAFPFWYRTPEALDPWVGAIGVTVLLLGAVGAWTLSRGRGLLVSVWLLPPLGAWIASLGGAPRIFEVSRYFTASWAVGVLLVVASLGVTRQRWRLALVVPILGLAIVGLLGTARYLRMGDVHPWRQIAETVNAESRPGEILFIHPYRVSEHLVIARYYDGRHERLQRANRLLLGELAGQRVPGVWIYFENPGPGTPELPRVIERRFPHEERWPVRRGVLMRRSRATAVPGQEVVATHRGLLVWGHEVRTFRACGSEAELWVVDGTGGRLERAHRRLTTEPYQPILVELVGTEGGEPAGEFAADYDGVLEVERLLAFSKEIAACEPSER